MNINTKIQSVVNSIILGVAIFLAIVLVLLFIGLPHAEHQVFYIINIVFVGVELLVLLGLFYVRTIDSWNVARFKRFFKREIDILV